MAKPIIETIDLGKKYHIHDVEKEVKGERSLTHRLKSALHYQGIDEVWALRNIDITVEQGDIVAVTGGNGSGKSTLFRLLSEITDPTEGEIILQGSVSSILEVGVGFHLELTGKENIYLNGTLLGMTIAGIDAHFDEIVSFSEIQQYINVPIKKYSSGMYVRLAFSVAAFLRTDILLVDEVLSVGDQAFREKAVAQMKKMAKEGSTIMIVSHDTQILRSLCQSAIRVEQGKFIAQGPINEILK